MDKKIAIFFVAAVLVVIAVFVILNKQSSTTPTNPSIQTQQTQKPIVPTNDVTVTVTKEGFTPNVVTIKTGTRVLWVNKDAGKVSVNSADHPTHLLYPKLNLGSFGNGSSVQLTFTEPGTYKYHNHFNPSQTGTVVVR